MPNECTFYPMNGTGSLTVKRLFPEPRDAPITGFRTQRKPSLRQALEYMRQYRTPHVKVSLPRVAFLELPQPEEDPA